MRLNAKIARLQISSLPDSIAKRVLQREEVTTLAELGSADIGAIGTFHFSDIRVALSNSQFGVPIDIARRRGGGTITLVRLETGLHVARHADGPEIVLPELALLDPAEDVRLRAYSEIVSRAKPCWSNCSFWREVLIERPLSDSELGRVIDELQHIGERELAHISAAVEQGSFGVSDLIPKSLSYYESLIGRIATTEPVDEYIAKIFMPHLASVICADTAWGLRCIRGASISSKVNVVAITGQISSDDLFAALLSLGSGPTPFSKLVTFQIAQSRAASDSRFDGLANDALDKLLERASPNGGEHEQDELFPAFMRLALNTISLNEELALAPPYWRRLAAFAHATILLETVNFQNWDTGKLIAWCDERQSSDTAAVSILDLIRSPLWRSDLQTAMDLDVLVLIRAVRWNPTGENHTTGLSPAQAESIRSLYPQFRLAFGLPDPLSSERPRNGNNLIETMGEELLQGFTGGTTAGLTLNSPQTWNALAYSSRIFAFSGELLVQVRAIAKGIHLEGLVISDEQFAMLSSAAEIAAIQSDEELAGILANCVLSAAERISHPLNSARCAAVLVIASGAVLDWHGSLSWAADRLVALAFRIPRGACSEELAVWIETMQRLIPLRERRWGKAWIIARSASR